MRALSLYQPWASAMARGLKQAETRPWRPSAALIGYRIALAATAKMMSPGWGALAEGPLRDDLREVGFSVQKVGVKLFHDLPLGCVVATGVLTDIVPTCNVRLGEEVRVDPEPHALGKVLYVTEREHRWGNYETGRFAWLFEDVVPVDPPAWARGKQGWWEWEPVCASGHPLWIGEGPPEEGWCDGGCV